MFDAQLGRLACVRHAPGAEAARRNVAGPKNSRQPRNEKVREVARSQWQVVQCRFVYREREPKLSAKISRRADTTATAAAAVWPASQPMPAPEIPRLRSKRISSTRVTAVPVPVIRSATR